MVLGAGLGTRLSPLTQELPKPLVWLGDKPLVDGIFDRLAAAGFSRAVMNTHWLPQAFDASWRRSQSLEVTLVHEPVILGTAGALANASDALGPGNVLLWNADISAELELAPLLTIERQGMTLVTGPRLPTGQGTLGLDDAGDVVRIRAYRAARSEVSSADYAGIALVPAHLRPVSKTFSCLVADVIIPALQRGDCVGTHPLETGFHDLGTPREYLAANQRWLTSRALDSYIHPSASVQSGVTLERTVVARNAEVTGQGFLTDCVVWPDARADAPLASSVVTPRTCLKVQPAAMPEPAP